jgi:O-antigen/teichoic acid export membrane protein
MRNPGASSRHTMDGTFRIFLAEALVVPCGLVVTAFLTRRFGPEGYGAYALAVGVVLWIEWSIVSVFNRPTLKLVAEAEDWKPVGATILRLHLLASLAATAFLVAAARPLATLLNEPALAAYLPLCALDVPAFVLAHAHRNMLVGLGGYRQRAAVTAARAVARAVLIVWLVSLGLSITGAILANVAASVLELALYRLHVRPQLAHPRPAKAAALWNLALPLLGAVVAMRILERLDLIAIKALGLDTAVAGHYSAAQNLAILPGLVTTALAPLLLASVSRMRASGQEEAAERLIRDALRVAFLLLPLAGVLGGCAAGVVGLVYGQDFLPAAPAFALLGLAGAGFAVIYLAVGIVIAVGQPRWSAWLCVPLVPVVLAGCVLLVPAHGAPGAAAATALSALFGATTSLAVLARNRIAALPFASLARCGVAGGAAYVIGSLWPASGVGVFAPLTLAATVAGGLLLVTGEFNRAEIRFVQAMLYPVPAPEQG